jgi:hypothetical protein
VFIAVCAVNQEDGHENEVEVGEDVVKAAGEGVGGGAEEVGCVVGVTGEAPPAGDEEVGVVGFAVA